MANTKISALTNGNPAATGDILPIDRAGSNFGVTAESVAALATLATLADVLITSPVESNALNFDSTTGKWVNAPIGWYTPSAGVSFSNDCSSLSGWTNNSAVLSVGPDPVPSIHVHGNDNASINGTVVAGGTVQFEVSSNPAGPVNFYFGCASNGNGPVLHFDGYLGGGGFWINGAGDWFETGSPTTGIAYPGQAAFTFYTIKIVIAADGLSASWYQDNVFQATGSLSGGIQGTYLGFEGGNNSGISYYRNIVVNSASGEQWVTSRTAAAGKSTLAFSYTGTNTPLINLPAMPAYANNAAALLGGLVAGDLYMVDASDPRQVAITF